MLASVSGGTSSATRTVQQWLHFLSHQQRCCLLLVLNPLIFDLEQFGVFQSRVSDDEDVEVCSVLSLVQGQYGHSKQEGGTAKAAGDLKSS